jgi:hypothetical protein
MGSFDQLWSPLEFFHEFVVGTTRLVLLRTEEHPPKDATKLDEHVRHAPHLFVLIEVWSADYLSSKVR